MKTLVKSGLLSIVLILTACSSKPTPPVSQHPIPNAGRYQQDVDSIPDRQPTMLEMVDPEPKAEQLSRGGNNPYQIFGQHYIPLRDLTEFNEIGIASWYGNKFHGHLTSNGEVYNMFAMTAAHKTLPLPSYVRVTNLENQQTAIVRVNDRGPFHRDRVIDLSYSAAAKIGMLQQGTARVKLELLTSPAMLAALPPAQCYIQIFASREQQRARELGQQVNQRWSMPIEIRAADGVYRLLVGPASSSKQAGQWLNRLKADSYPQAYFFDSQACS
ncbi:septal ring lytic transglycosylase RlpA family protein [Arsukibacterium sp.]|uniref:septal ring lytic transglycosylase RlpA family protein n=1 Tax=Arsukibacterium sp. TaxID=1977258 RepID=UPI002FDB2CB2